MPSSEILFGGDGRTDTISYAFKCTLAIEEDDGLVELIWDFSYSEPELKDETFRISQKARISNPIELLVVVAALKSKYALCVAGGVLGNTAKELYVAYDDSKKKFPKDATVSIKDRTLAFGQSIKGRAANIRGGVIGYAAACAAADLVFPAMFS